MRGLLAACAVAAAAAACGAAATPPGTSAGAPEVGVARSERLEPEYDETGKLRKLQYDRDADGKVDTWGFMDGSRVVRVEVDENGDGRVDRWEFHRPNAAPGATAAMAGPEETVERIERAMRFDGQVSRREYFDHGELTRIEEDTDGNGTVDKWETYSGGTLSMVALDTSGRGRPDRRLVYRADGSFDRIEEDPNGSGSFRPVTP